jgi:MinD-like ATPase involved in chromosome partitioning or flagellar assembly
VSGLARAFDETGRSVIVVDLSRNSPFPIYMACPRWQSTEYASLLTEGLVPERSLLDRWIVEAPNGVHVFLPPAGGADVRDLWLRSEEQFESSLTVIEFLKERYDIVLVDCGQAEGLLHFALQAQSAFRVLVTSNEPASVHMLHSEIGALKDVPGDGALKLVVNETTDHALSRGDVESFLELIEQYEDEMLLSYIAHDKRAWRWVGTGNTFYDESKKATRRELLNLAKCFIGSTEEEDASGEDLQTQPKRLGWVKESSEANASSQKTGGIISLPLLRSREPEQQEAVEEESSEPIIMEAPEVVKAQPTKPKLLRPKVTNSDLAGRPAQISAERAASQKSDSNEYQKPQLVSE